MPHKILPIGAATALAFAATVSCAGVEVRFVEPDKYADVRDFAGYRDQQRVLDEIQAHFQALGDRQLAPGRDLLIEITDIDLAGQVEPIGRRMEMLRVMRSVGGPSMQLRYILRDASGKELSKGETRLSDLGYMEGLNRYPSGDPLRYEKRMMDKWFNAEFAAEERKVTELVNGAAPGN